MFGTEIATFVLIGAISLFTALTAIWLLTLIARFDRPRPRGLLAAPAEARAFLFDGHLLLEATPAGHAWLEEAAPNGDPLSTLIDRLAPRLPDLAERLSTLMNFQSPFEVSHSDAASHLDVRGGVENGLLRIDVRERPVAVDTLTLPVAEWRATLADLALLRTMADRAPVLAWRQAADGRIDWANAAYGAMAESLGHARGGPPPRLFPASAALASGDQRAPRRLSLSHPGEPRTWWFDSSSYPAEDGATLHFAIHANPLVRAEEALRNFVQTLTQTFAHLPIGLAIFDRQRQLALFNPALSDLTRLEPEWLTARPTLHAVLDRLRDRRMMPEPKDYRSWREQLADLERAARNGTYEEIWPLPTGQTYRITGRPHPEGAVAFLLEDISAEVSLKRRFRAELELSQSVIDSLDEAIAVFSPSGRLVLSNAAYAALWGHDPSTTLGEVGIADATRHWRELTRPTPVWGELRDFASQASARGEWTAEVALKDGSPLSCRFSPLARSATLCAFSRAAPAPRPEPARRPAAAALG